MRSAPAQVHPQQHLGPVLRLGAAGASLDIQKCTVRIHLAAEHALELEPAHTGLELTGIAFDLARRGLIVLELGQFEQLRRIADRMSGAIEFRKLGDQPRALAPELLGTLGCAPDCRVLQLAADFL